MITIEQIDEFRKRTNSSYEDARVFLERHQGDVLDAIIDFEKTKAAGRPPVKKPQQKGELWRWILELLQKGFDLRMTVEDKTGKLLFTVPVLLLLLLTPAWPMLLISCLFLILLGFKLGFRDIKSTAVNVQEIFNTVGTQFRDASGHHYHRDMRGTHRQPGAAGGRPTQAAQGPNGMAGSAPMTGYPVRPETPMTTQSFGRNPAQMGRRAPVQPPVRPSTVAHTQAPIGFVQPVENRNPIPAGQVMTLPPQEPARQDANPMVRRPRDEKRETTQTSPVQTSPDLSAPIQAPLARPELNQPVIAQAVPNQPDVAQPEMASTASVQAAKVPMGQSQPVMPETQPVTDFSMEDDGFAEFTIE